MSGDETFQFQKQNNFGYSNYHDDRTLKQKSFVGTFQEGPSYLSHGRNSLEANAGNVYEETIGVSSFGGSFRHAVTDGKFFGGNFGTSAFDDAQVVPDFSDVLETIHVDMDKTSVSSAPFVAESEAFRRDRQLENRDSSGPKRRNSERDELEIYFPCVLTPIPVDRLYSTLVDDSTVFKFPPTSAEFLPDEKSKHGLSSEPGGNYNVMPQDNRHSLDSFANHSIFSFPAGSEEIFDISYNKLELTAERCQQQEVSDAWISTRGKDYDSAEERNCYTDSGPSCIIEQHVLPLSTISTTSLGNNLKFEDSLTNSSCPGAINTVSGENNNEAKDFTPGKSSQTFFDLPIQLTAPTSQQYPEFAPCSTVNTDFSLNLVSLDGWRNRCAFDSPVEKPISGNYEYSEGGESCFGRNHTGFLELAPLWLNSSIYSKPEYTCTWKPTRAKELSRDSNTSLVKTKATANKKGSDEENSADVNTRTRDRMKRSRKSRPSRAVGMEQGSFYHGNSRGFHNDMEKQRRINMKTRLQNLRMAVPELLENGKASKIAILQKALEYIGLLEKESVELERMKRTERLKNIELLNKLQKITAGKC